MPRVFSVCWKLKIIPIHVRLFWRLPKTGIAAAAAIGKAVAERAKAVGVTAVAFDRSGFKYHGRVKALADAARETGLEF